MAALAACVSLSQFWLPRRYRRFGELPVMIDISLALDRYDRQLPIIDGRVSGTDGLRVRVFEVGQETAMRDGSHRHERMLRHAEFDAAEVSLSSFLIAKSRGLPFTAIPVFPRRLFSQTQMFVAADSSIRHPRDLIGKRVGLQSFQTTLAVLAKGDLAHEYEIGYDAIRWVVKKPETLALGADALPFETLAAGADFVQLLLDGELDAIFSSRTPAAPVGAIRRLFPDARAEALRYLDRNRWFPIMHVIAVKDELLSQEPELADELTMMFEAAWNRCRQDYADPGWLVLPFARLDFEQYADACWPAGLTANRPYLERFCRYASEQRLIKRDLTVEELFEPASAR